MISARKLLKDSYYMLVQHPSLFFYGILYFLPSMISIISILFLALSVGSLSLIAFSFPSVVKMVAGVLFGSVGTLFLLAFIFFANVIISLGFTIYIESILQKTHVSMLVALKRSWNICFKVGWVVPTYMVYFFLLTTPFWFLALIAYCYIHQLLIDGEASFSKCFSLSWRHFKQTFWVLVRFFILLVFATSFCFLVAIVFLMFLATLFSFSVGAFLNSIALLSFGILLYACLFLFWIPGFIIFRIGINKIYLEVK
jgi:hypothetical protein